jgi:hypothetical protein
METVIDPNGQVFDVLNSEDRPQDESGDGRGLRYTTREHDEVMMPRVAEAPRPSSAA